MIRKMVIACFLLAFYADVNAQLRSPDDFLGYKLGTRYTPHWKIVNYFNHAVANATGLMKIQVYGETNEGRPLLLAFISSSENIINLENIRKNNLRLANLSGDKAAANENAPAIVWLSYNVHGNETSSSEAAMMTLYALLDPANSRTKEWLKNTVVIIDPCLNPDGRDRYVNWFNSVAGKNVNPDRVAREHREPWPGGRTNHYNFDLNRDWAWQTQVESQQRIKIYSQWLPHVHVDYHEQGINEPYYFAPAVQPFHEVITQWQRDFQVTIGRNNAKYFDENGWLFFTKEVFDLFYPSYGDTYPVYNGSVGMTYEQGGGPAGGLGVINDEGDTLSLLDRVNHHYSTSLSTIEIASLNASKLVKEFRKFFNDAVQAGIGEYKTYIIKNDPVRSERITALLKLLDKNNIQYGTAQGSGKGFNYVTGKEESFSISNNDIIVSAFQPRSALVKVLFEPRPKLVDSATYDISAWGLPYAYGLTAYATKDRINTNGGVMKPTVVNTETNYGYVIPWKGVQTVKAVGQLLQKGILLRYAEQPFEVNGNKFDRGAIIVLRTANRSQGRDLWKTVRQVADLNGIQLFPVSTGFVDKGADFGSDKVHPFRAPRIALMTGEGVSSGGAGEVWHFFEQELDYPVTLINANDFTRIDWNDYNVLILPSGNYKFLSDKAQTEDLKNWISKGGRLVALEEAVTQLARAEIGIKIKKADDKDTGDYQALRVFENRERDFISGVTPGAIWKVELDNSHPLAFGYPDHYFTLKLDDNMYEFIKESGWNVGVIKRSGQVAGFVGARLQPKMKDGLIFGVQNMGSGTITYLGDNVLFRNFWENGKLMFCNAVFLVGN
jgi:hypothetical protein